MPDAPESSAPYSYWDDKEAMNDSRIRALLSEDFSTVPEDVDKKNSWDDKLAFWKQAVMRYCVDTDTVVCDAATLRRALAWKGLHPMGMPGVMHRLELLGSAVTVDEFRKGNYGERTLAKTLINVAASPIRALRSWILQAPEPAGHAASQTRAMVMMPLLKDASEMFLELFGEAASTLSERIVTQDEAVKMIVGVKRHEEKLMVLEYLAAKKAIRLFALENGTKGVRLVSPDDSTVAVDLAMEQTLLNLKVLVEQLDRDIDKLEQQRQGVMDKTREYLKAKQQQAALATLRLSKAMDNQIQTRRSQKQKVYGMLTTLEDSHMTAQTFDALVSSSNVLSAANKSLQDKDIEKHMIEVEEAVLDAREISEAVTAAGSVFDPSVDEAELERELNDIAEEEEALRAFAALSLAAKPPSTTPAQPKQEPARSPAAAPATNTKTAVPA